MLGLYIVLQQFICIIARSRLIHSIARSDFRTKTTSSPLAHSLHRSYSSAAAAAAAAAVHRFIFSSFICRHCVYTISTRRSYRLHAAAANLRPTPCQVTSNYCFAKAYISTLSYGFEFYPKLISTKLTKFRLLIDDGNRHR